MNSAMSSGNTNTESPPTTSIVGTLIAATSLHIDVKSVQPVDVLLVGCAPEVVPPAPATVAEPHHVVAQAASDAGLRALGRGSHGDLEDRLERVVRRWPLTNATVPRCSGVITRPGLFTDGVTSITTARRTRSGRVAARRIVVAPPSDMPTTAPAAGARRSITSATARVLPRAVVAVAAPVGVAVARQIDRQHRTVQGDDDAVPGVRVLPAAVEDTSSGSAVPQRMTLSA